MSTDERDRALLLYIQESIVRIEKYIAGGKEIFLRETIIQDAVVRRLETLADAAGQLSDALKARHPEIPWREMHGFRNVAAHGYLELNLERVWNTVAVHLPGLKAVVGMELRRLMLP